jgi:hypothetical protein
MRKIIDFSCHLWPQKQYEEAKVIHFNLFGLYFVIIEGDQIFLQQFPILELKREVK